MSFVSIYMKLKYSRNIALNFWKAFDVFLIVGINHYILVNSLANKT